MRDCIEVFVRQSRVKSSNSVLTAGFILKETRLTVYGIILSNVTKLYYQISSLNNGYAFNLLLENELKMSLADKLDN